MSSRTAKYVKPIMRLVIRLELTQKQMQNCRTLGQPLLGEKYVTQKEEEEERNIIPKIVDTTFCCNAQGQRKRFARTDSL